MSLITRHTSQHLLLTILTLTFLSILLVSRATEEEEFSDDDFPDEPISDTYVPEPDGIIPNYNLTIYEKYPSLGTTHFIQPLFVQAMPEDVQIVYSPLAVQMNLCLAALGAGKNTFDEIHWRFGCRHENLAQFVEVMHNHSNSVQLVNAMFPSMENAILKEFLKESDKYYDAFIEYVDYYSDSLKARRQLNDYMKEATHNKLKHNLLPEVKSVRPGLLPRTTSNVLFSGIWVDSQWLYPFPSFQVQQDAPFTALRRGIKDEEIAETVKVTRLRTFAQHVFRFAQHGGGAESIHIPLALEGLEAVFLKPGHVSFAALREAEKEFFRKGMTNSTWEVFRRIEIPQFAVESTFDMRPYLKMLGLHDMFRADYAHFPKLSEQRSIINYVFTWASLAINKDGIHSATIPEKVVFPEFEMEPNPQSREFVIDGPFVCAIRYLDETLLVARILNPTRPE